LFEDALLRAIKFTIYKKKRVLCILSSDLAQTLFNYIHVGAAAYYAKRYSIGTFCVSPHLIYQLMKMYYCFEIILAPKPILKRFSEFISLNL